VKLSTRHTHDIQEESEMEDFMLGGILDFIISIGFDLPRKTAHHFSQAISKLSSNREETEKQFSKS